MRYVDLSAARLEGAHLEGITLEGGRYDDLPAAALRLLNLKERVLARASFKGADLSGMHLEGVDLTSASLEGATLVGTHLEGAILDEARLVGANLTGAYLEGTHLDGAVFEGANLTGVALDSRHLKNVSLKNANCTGASFRDATFENPVFAGANFAEAHLEGTTVQFTAARPFDLQGVNFAGAHLAGFSLAGLRLDGEDLHEMWLAGVSLAGAHPEKTNLAGAHLEGATLAGACLQGANLAGARLEGTNLREARLEEANLSGAHLEGADLRHAVFNPLTNVAGVSLGGRKHGDAALGGLFWSDVDLTTVDWAPVARLGDERIARQDKEGDRAAQLAAYVAAIRAYRQLAVQLDKQGLGEPAARFSYRALVLQRHLLWRQVTWRGQWHKLGPYLFSLLLALLTGYGYRMWRILVVYACVIATAAAAYAVIGAATGAALPWYDAPFASVTAFHGRVFTGQFQPGSPQLWVSAVEAVAGLLIESVFIAMLTRRFFGK